MERPGRRARHSHRPPGKERGGRPQGVREHLRRCRQQLDGLDGSQRAARPRGSRLPRHLGGQAPRRRRRLFANHPARKGLDSPPRDPRLARPVADQRRRLRLDDEHRYWAVGLAAPRARRGGLPRTPTRTKSTSTTRSGAAAPPTSPPTGATATRCTAAKGRRRPSVTPGLVTTADPRRSRDVHVCRGARRPAGGPGLVDHGGLVGPVVVSVRTEGNRSAVGLRGAAVDPKGPAADVLGDADPWADLWFTRTRSGSSPRRDRSLLADHR